MPQCARNSVKTAAQASQIYLRLLQQDDPCQKSVVSPSSSLSTVQARQFSSGELKGSSLQPNVGTALLVLAHSHTPSSSISFPAIQYSLLLLLLVLLTMLLTSLLFSCVWILTSSAPFCRHILRASIHPTLSLEMK